VRLSILIKEISEKAQKSLIKRAERGFSELSQKTRGRKLKSAPPSIHNIVTLSTENSTPNRMEDGPVYALERTI
jgi:hypothetical protein